MYKAKIAGLLGVYYRIFCFYNEDEYHLEVLFLLTKNMEMNFQHL
jgi:hypothetical protein